MGTITVNIAANLSNPLHDLIVEKSMEIQRRTGSGWYVDDKRYVLHFPFYLMEMPEKNLEKLVAAGRDLAKKIKPIEVRARSLFANDDGLLMIGFEEKVEIDKIHRQCLEIFNPIREGCLREKYRDEMFLAKLSDDEREKIQKYGHIFVLERYAPHVTIARIKERMLMEKILEDYQNVFVGVKGCLSRFQIHQAVWGPEGKSVLLVDEEIK